MSNPINRIARPVRYGMQGQLLSLMKHCDTSPPYVIKTLVTAPDVNRSQDVIIVGGGIIGTAIARELITRCPKIKITLMEKENRLAPHQSGHNSGVVHAGIYYAAGSLKARLCVEGHRESYKYFEQKGIPYRKVGKLIVANDKTEVERLKDLMERGKNNGVQGMKLLDSHEAQLIEPNVRCIQAIWSPETGIVDWGKVTQSYGQDFQLQGGSILYDCSVSSLMFDKEQGVIRVKDETGKERSSAPFIITAGGLHSDKLASLTGCPANPIIVPFRGEYLLFTKPSHVRTNVYPVPDPRFPFLGVHFTPRMDGSVWVGPNAVLAMSREGYSWKEVDGKHLKETLSHAGFQKLALKFAWKGLQEMYGSLCPHVQVAQAQRMMHGVTQQDFVRGPSGVRAQALDLTGNLVDDFIFHSGSGPFHNRVLHVRNAPSPAATSSLAIARVVVDRVQKTFQLN